MREVRSCLCNVPTVLQKLHKVFIDLVLWTTARAPHPLSIFPQLIIIRVTSFPIIVTSVSSHYPLIVQPNFVQVCALLMFILVSPLQH